MPAEIVDLEAHRLRPYVMSSIEQYLGDPPDTDFQRGYLAALLTVYEEGMGQGAGDARVEAARRLAEAR